jgi:PAS domain S-box-containing protein
MKASHAKSRLALRASSPTLRRSRVLASPDDASCPDPNGNGVKSEGFYERLFKTLPCASVILDELTNVREANNRFWEFLGFKKRRLIGTPFSTYVHRDSLADFLRHLRNCRKSGKPGRADILLKRLDSSTIPVRLYTQMLPDREIRFHVSLMEDSDRQEVRAAEREKLALLDFIDSVEGIVWEMDVQTARTTYLSQEAGRLLGYPSTEWSQGHEFHQRHLFVEDRDRVLNQFARAAASRKNFVVEYRVIAADRRLVWLRDAVTVREVDGRLKFRGVAVDMTDRKKAESQAAQVAEELEKRVQERTAELQWTISELETFSYTLSHDMRAPLRSIQGFAQLIAESMVEEAAPESKMFLERIIKSTRRLDAMVQDVLKYGGLAKAKIDLKPVDLDILVRSMVEEAPELKAARAVVEINDHLLPVLGHEGFLTQCLSNLFSNAAKFVAPGITPRIHVRTECQEDKNVLLWIEDNGIGIAPENLLRVFKVLERCHPTEKYEGTGLGLAIVERAARRMNGSVGVESVVGKGSKFWIKLMGA